MVDGAGGVAAEGVVPGEGVTVEIVTCFEEDLAQSIPAAARVVEL